MSKCDVNAQALKQIQSRIAQTLMMFRAQKQPVSVLKQNMVKLLNEIAENYSLAEVTKITGAIYDIAQRFGVVDQSSNFFSVENLTNLLTGADQGIQRIDTLETSADKLTDTEQVRTRLEANKEFLDNAYGLAKEVRMYVVNQTNQNVFDCCFINRGSVNQNLGIVKTNSELNENIRQYQQTLLERITDYFNYIVSTSPNLQLSPEIRELLANPVLYEVIDGKIQNTGILENLKGLIDAYLSAENFSPEILRDLYITANDPTKPQADRDYAKRRLDAYNANVILTHFDSYLSVTLGKAIQIKDFNVKTGEDKYQIASQTSKLTTTWRTSEDINVESEADAITKLAINTTPLFRWQSDTPINGQYLHFSDFEHVVAKIKDLSYREDVMGIRFDNTFAMEHPSIWNSLTYETREFLMGKTLSQAINFLRRNPRQYISAIFELLTNAEFYDLHKSTFLGKKVFTEDELNKMYSISKGVFNPTSPSSLYTLTGMDFDTDYYSFVTQTVDSIFKVSYLQYYRDQDGIIQVRTLIDQSVNNIRRGIEQTINTSNSVKLIKNFDDFRRELTLNPNGGDDFKFIQFELPISSQSIGVKVVASSGSVTFTDKTTGKTITNFEQLWKNEEIREYLDTVLRIGISTDIDFQNALKNELRSYNEMCKSLLQFAARVHLNQYISQEILQGMSNIDREAKVKELYGQNAPKYDYQLDELGLVHGNDIPTLRAIALAKANITGVTTASQVKDGEGNGQSLQTLSRLLGSLQSQFDLQERQPWSATNESILLTVPGLYEGVFTAKEFYNPSGGDNKASTDMTVSEMSYAGLIQDFVGGLMQREDNSIVGNGHVLFLPSVNSDKGTIGRLKINLNKEVTVNGVTKSIRDLNPTELETLIAQEFGTIYTKMYNAIVTDWQTFQTYLQQQFPSLPNLAQDYLHGFSSFNTWWHSQASVVDLETNEPIGEYFKDNFGNSPAEFIKHFVLEYNQSHRLQPIELIDQVHYKSNKGNLGINQAFISQIARFNPQFLLNIDPSFDLTKYPTSYQFWATKKAEMLKGLLKSKFRVNTTSTKQVELQHIRDNYSDWINYSGDMILAKAMVDGQVIKITSNRDIALLQEKFQINNTNELINKLSAEYSLQLNPILEQYNYLDYLFTQEFMCATVGSFIAHPEKSKSNDVLQQEAAHFQAQHKRNVSFTAAMHAFQLNLLNGIPEVYNIAVIDDIKDEQGTILGLLNEIKPFDGATFVNPFVVILENNSLGGARAGITKKQFVHFKNERTGTGGIIKTAGFGLTNDWIRNSPFLERMMRKMTDHVWLNQNGSPAIVDITTDYKGNKIKFKDFYFKVGDKIFKIEEINSLGNNTYQRVIREVGLDGTPTSDFITEAPVTINTNYQLWNFFGGKNSMTMDGRYLKLSNTSVENVVQAMNNVGTVIGNPARVETQDQLWQPLKHVDVHYVPTAGAVKQGAANINSAAKYSNDEAYDIQRIRMYQSGIQLDKEHHADDSELSLMTQVISACAAKGYTLEAAIGLYDALRKSTEIGTRDHLDAVKALFTTGSNTDVALQEVMMKAIVTALGTSNSENFAKVLASDLIKKAREGKEIKFAEAMLPLSDNTVYSKVFSIIASYLTNSGIKQKIPGILSVLTPSHNIFQLYAGRKYESFTNPREELAQLEREQDPIFQLSSQVPILLKTGEVTGDLNLFQTPLSEEVEIEDVLKPWRNDPTRVNNTRRVYLKGQQERGYFEVVKDDEDGFYSVHFKPTDANNPNAFSKEEKNILFQAVADIIPNGARLSTHGEISTGGIAGLNRFLNLGFTQEGTRTLQRKVDAKNNISNLELGRSYKVTRLVPTEFTPEGDPDWNTLQPITQVELIRTPNEYQQLKADIGQGLVTQVTEAFLDLNGNPLGRDLAAYNVRFEDDNGEHFQLWDLDSAVALFEYNETLNSGLDGMSKDEALIAIAERALGRTFTTDDLPNLEVLIRRMLQRDLMNLSRSTPALNRQYKTLLDSRENTQVWFNKFAQWVNIHLGTGLGSEIELNGQRMVVRADNFNVIEPQVRQLLANTTKVKIGGQLVTVNKSSVRIQAYELIMPKTFATNFGLKEFDDLNTIKNDQDFFIKQYLSNQATKVGENQYALELKVSSGDHYYLLTKRQAINSRLTKVDNIFTIEITPDTEIYTDNLGHEIIVTDDLNAYVENLHFDSIKLSNSLRERPSVINSLISSFRKSKKKQVKSFANYITAYGTGIESIYSLNNELHSISVDTYQSLIKVDPVTGKRTATDPIIRAGWEKHTSFLKSLDVVAARIPAQSMQSFMPMKVVAYDNPDINTAHVSTMQILLQGSDF